MRFKDKVAIVAGGGGAIGQGVAVALGSEGAQVVVWDVDEGGARGTEQQIKGKGGQALGMKVDALQYDEVKDAVSQVLERFGQIDIMVVVTPAEGVSRPFKDMTPEFWQEQVDSLSKMAFNCNQAVIEPMVKRSYGKILNLISTTGGAPNLAAHGAGNAIVASLAQTMAVELAPHTINVNCLVPGTDTPEGVARVALFLLSDDAERLTGQTFCSR